MVANSSDNKAEVEMAVAIWWVAVVVQWRGEGGEGTWRWYFRPGSCRCPSGPPLVPDTLSLSGCQCISESISRTQSTPTERRRT